MQVRALESTCPLHMSEHGSERVGLALGSRSATVPKMSVLWGYAGAGTCPNKSGYNTCSVNPSLDDLSASGASVARGPWRSCIRLIDYRTFAADAGRGEPSDSSRTHSPAHPPADPLEEGAAPPTDRRIDG